MYDKANILNFVFWNHLHLFEQLVASCVVQTCEDIVEENLK